MITYIFFAMVMTQSAAYLWFQSKGGIVSHRNYMLAHACFMVGQSAQAIESYGNGAFASFIGAQEDIQAPLEMDFLVGESGEVFQGNGLYFHRCITPSISS